MFKVIGIIVVIAAVCLGVAHFTGHLNFSSDLEVTSKGEALMEKGIDEGQDLTNKGWDALRDTNKKKE